MPSTLRIIRLGVVTLGAATRLVRLAAHDDITSSLRRRIPDPNQRDAITTGNPAMPAPAHPRWAWPRRRAYDLVTCPWCVAIWIAPLVVAAAHAAGHTRTYRYTADSLTVALAAGWLAQLADNADQGGDTL